MMRISRGITEAELEHTVNWHFTLDGLNAASDRVVHLMDRLDLPNLLRRLPEQLHTSSDGQKFEVRVDSLNANYSFKYFGKEQGVAAYTFRDERDLLWYSTVFSAAERESAYVIDGLMHNEVVKSDIHSTDAFGFSELVFAVSHLLGFSYAPRFKNLPRQRLYIFRNRKGVDRSAWKIKPAGYADDEIVQQWDEILRMIATIKLNLGSISSAQLLFEAARSVSGVEGLRASPEIAVYPTGHRRSSAEASHREATGSDRARAPVHARRLGRQSTGISTGGERGPEDGGSLQAAHQKLHHLLELSLPVAKVGRDRGCREPAGVSRCCGTRLGDFLAAHQLAGRV
jgi:hypothetical protein